MRQKSRVLLGLLLILCASVGCKTEQDKELSVSGATSVPTRSLTPSLQPTQPDVIGTVAPIQTTELPIYTINNDLVEVMAVTALVPEEEEITEQLVVHAVVDALADSAIYVTVNQVTTNGTVVVVDFSSETPPVTQVGASIEGMILDAFGQSILDNIADCNGVSFTVDGEVYSSGHFELEKDDIYVSR